jgi:ABC-type Co2+ transport system permease subunit
MATCSRCGGHLTDDHVCSGRLTTTATLLLEILVAVAFGGLAGVLLFGELGFFLTGASYWVVGLLVGPFVAFAIIRAVRSP